MSLTSPHKDTFDNYGSDYRLGLLDQGGRKEEKRRKEAFLKRRLYRFTVTLKRIA